MCSDVPRIFFPGRRAPAIAPMDGISCSGEPLTPTEVAFFTGWNDQDASSCSGAGPNINSRLKGAVDRELGGEYIRICSPFFDLFCICAEKLFL